MSEDDSAPDLAPPASVPELAGRMADDVSQLEKELTEVDLLIDQARTEAGRHETRRSAVADKLAAATKAATDAGEPLEPALSADLNGQLVLLTKRAA